MVLGDCDYVLDVCAHLKCNQQLSDFQNIGSPHKDTHVSGFKCPKSLYGQPLPPSRQIRVESRAVSALACTAVSCPKELYTVQRQSSSGHHAPLCLLCSQL